MIATIISRLYIYILLLWWYLLVVVVAVVVVGIELLVVGKIMFDWLLQ